MSNIITFIDPIGRTMLAELVEETETQLTVKNPAIIHVQMPFSDSLLARWQRMPA